ncbi:MAG: phosphatase PAP2 family protein [Candidatus Aenigmarchaeota archaeon]|nr:phosphatase PAP2 family protein [Candidatus Aenigmarchaeota archaeon]
MREEHFRDITSFGGMPLYLVVMFVFLIFKNYQILSYLGFGLVAAYIITVFFRVVYFKKRPEKQKYNNWLQKIDASSFPSLHAMRGALLAVIMASFFANIFLTILFVALATGVAVTRVFLKRHDPIDSGVGLFTGFAIGILVLFYAPTIILPF